MADVNRGNRPLSPFMTSYRQPFNAILSIMHRITGAGMALAGILTVIWFLGAASGPETFQSVDDFITSWIIGLIMLGSLAMLWYHLCNGIRHLIWDAGHGYEKPAVRRTGIIMLAVAGTMTLVTWIIGYL